MIATEQRVRDFGHNMFGHPIKEADAEKALDAFLAAEAEAVGLVYDRSTVVTRFNHQRREWLFGIPREVKNESKRRVKADKDAV